MGFYYSRFVPVLARIISSIIPKAIFVYLSRLVSLASLSFPRPNNFRRSKLYSILSFLPLGPGCKYSTLPRCETARDGTCVNTPRGPRTIHLPALIPWKVSRRQNQQIQLDEYVVRCETIKVVSNEPKRKVVMCR